jgi:hypothetical protein
MDLPTTAHHSSTALATPRSLQPPAAPTTFWLPACSSVDIAPCRAAAPSPDRFSDPWSPLSSPIAFGRPVKQIHSPGLSTISPNFPTASPCLSTTVSQPDPSSSLRPIADAGGCSRAHRETKKQKKPEPKPNSGGSEENIPPAEEEIWVATDRLC